MKFLSSNLWRNRNFEADSIRVGEREARLEFLAGFTDINGGLNAPVVHGVTA